MNGDAAKNVVKKELGRDYSTNEETARKVLPIFIPLWPEAARRAKRVRNYHSDAATPDPANYSTEVDRLVCSLNDSAPEYARKAI